MNIESAQIVVRRGTDLKAFREEVVPANTPVVFRDLVKDWPAVQAGMQGPRALGAYLRGMDQGQSLSVLEGPPAVLLDMSGVAAQGEAAE